MKIVNGFRNTAFIFVLILIFGLSLAPITNQIPVYSIPVIFALAAALLHYLFQRQTHKPNIQLKQESNNRPKLQLEEAYLKLAKAKTDILNKEESLRKFSRIIEQSPTSIVITDLEGNIEYVNPRFCAISGYKYEEVIGKNPRVLKSGETPAEGYSELWKTISNGQVWRGEFHNKKKDGSLYWEFAHIAPVKNEQGRVTHFISIKEDITSKKAIDESRKMYSKALHSISDIVTMVDLNGNLIYVNDAFKEAFGYKEDNVLGKHFRFIFPADTPEKLLSKIFNYQIDSGWHGDVRTITKQGHIFYIALSTSVVTDDSGKPVAMVAVARDLTEEKSIQEISRKAEMLTTVQELAGSVSHEFSQPLQALSNYIGLIKMGKLKKEYVNKSELAIKRISALVDNLSEITHIQKQDYLNTKIINLKSSSRKNRQVTQKKILIVDDEQQILETITEMLRLAGYECDGAPNGLEALQMVSKNQYQLIISDINMPRMNGIRLFEKLKVIGYKEAFIFLTGYSLPNELAYIMDEVDGLLNKPIDMKKLIKITEDIIGKSNKREE